MTMTSMENDPVDRIFPDMLTSHSLPAVWPESSKEILKCPSSVLKTLSGISPPDNFLKKGVLRQDTGRTKTVISMTSDHAPFLPDHCKKVPTRRIVPTEVRLLLFPCLQAIYFT